MPIQKESLKDKIVTILMQRIIAGELPLGEKIREAHLAKEFGVSQAPVREAIITLVARGILEHTPNIGTQVKFCTKEETLEIYRTREAFEVIVAEENLDYTDQMIYELDKHYSDMITAAKNNDVKSFVISDQKFHTILMRSSNNTLLLELWTQLYTRSSVQTVIKEHDADLNDIAKLHLPIIEAIKQNNTQAYKDAIKAHYTQIIKDKYDA